MKSVLLLLAIVAVASALYTEEEIKAKFADFTHKYNKVYTTAEFGTRYANFKATLATIAEQQAASPYATFGINKFSDMSPEEFRSKILMNNANTPVTPLSAATPASTTAPASFDWRTKGAVTAVKDQGQCGSCWAFSATEAIESAWILKGYATSTSINLSPQQIVDCDSIDGVQGCNGGFTESAYDYIVQAGGQEPIKDYPYTAVNGKCKFDKPDIVANITGYTAIPKDESTLPDTLSTTGPLSICLDAAKWQNYQSGVLTARECCPLGCQMDHCVQAVGYDTTASVPYWIVRNSWNTDWGIDGYIWLEMNKNTCGLANDVTFPKVA